MPPDIWTRQYDSSKTRNLCWKPDSFVSPSYEGFWLTLTYEKTEKSDYKGKNLCIFSVSVYMPISYTNTVSCRDFRSKWLTLLPTVTLQSPSDFCDIGPAPSTVSDACPHGVEPVPSTSPHSLPIVVCVCGGGGNRIDSVDGAEWHPLLCWRARPVVYTDLCVCKDAFNTVILNSSPIIPDSQETGKQGQTQSATAPESHSRGSGRARPLTR